jgi:two-component system response regulator WspF
MRIGIVNDLPMAVEAMKRALAVRPDLELAWSAANGAEAVKKAAEDTPDLILMDLIMPVMDGVEATRRIMEESPCAVLIVTVSVGANVSKVYAAMGHGALDAVDTPALGFGDPRVSASPLLNKISTIGKLIGSDSTANSGDAARPGRGAAAAEQLVAIGSSAGGPAALAEVFRLLPADFPAAIVVVQHVDAQFAPGLAEWLNGQAKIKVRLAMSGDRPEPGVALVAGTADHLVFTDPSTLGYTPHPRDYAYRPSVDTFYESVIKHWRGAVEGVLLTGMGRDGAIGLKALRDAGHHTITQDKASCAVYGMPKAAAAINAAVEILPLDRIGPALLSRFTQKGAI